MFFEGATLVAVNPDCVVDVALSLVGPVDVVVIDESMYNYNFGWSNRIIFKCFHNIIP